MPKFLTLLFVLAGSVASTSAEVVSNWQTKPLELQGAELVQHLGEVPDTCEDDLRYAYRRFETEYHTDRSQSVSQYTVVQCVTLNGADSLQQHIETWAPWLEEQPVLQIRVTHPDGSVIEADLRDAIVGPVGEISDGVYSDQMSYQIPLPKLKLGSIVEVFKTSRVKVPWLPVGPIEQIYLTKPLEYGQIEVRAPAELDLQLQVKHIDVVPHETFAAGQKRWNIEIHQAGAFKPELFVPAEHEVIPTIKFGLRGDWSEMAAQYSRIVDEKMETDVLRGIVEGLITPEMSRDEQIEAIASYLHEHIKYTGIEYGQAAFVPATTSTLLERSYGDCKDQSTFMVGLLRAAGIPADVVLVNTDNDLDLDFPASNVFNHMILTVYQQGAEPQLWIDPTAPFAHHRDEHRYLQNANVLVINPKTSGLTHIPVSDQPDSQRNLTIDVHFGEGGALTVDVVDVQMGVAGMTDREAFARLSRKDQRDYLLETYEETLGLTSITKLKTTDPRELSRPFQIEFSATVDTEYGVLDGSQAFAQVSCGPVLDQLVTAKVLAELRERRQIDEFDDPRRLPLLVRPFKSRVEYRIHLPAGFTEVETMPQIYHQCGGLTYSLNARSRPHRNLYSVTYDLIMRDDQLSAADAESLIELLREESLHSEEMWATFNTIFHCEAVQQVEDGDFNQGLAGLKAAVTERSDDVSAQCMYIKSMLLSGLGHSARKHAMKHLDPDSDSTDVQFVLGLVEVHNEFGQEFAGSIDIEKARHHFNRAIELTPDYTLAYRWLQRCYCYHPKTEWYGNPSELKQALAINERCFQHCQVDADDWDLKAKILLFSNQFDELLKLSIDPNKGIPYNAAVLAASMCSQGDATTNAMLERSGLSVQQAMAIGEQAGVFVIEMCRYDVSLRISQQAIQAGQAPQETGLGVKIAERILENRRRHQDLYPVGDPRRALQLLARAYVLNPANPHLPEGIEVKGTMRTGSMQLLPNSVGLLTARSTKLDSKRWLCDFMSLFNYSAQSLSSDLWHCRITDPEGKQLDKAAECWVTRSGGKFTVWDCGADDEMTGQLCEQLIAQGQYQVAQRVMDIVAQQRRAAHEYPSRDAFGQDAFASLWSEWRMQNVTAYRLAATALASRNQAGAKERYLSLSSAFQREKRLGYQVQIARIMSAMETQQPELLGTRMTDWLGQSFPTYTEVFRRKAEQFTATGDRANFREFLDLLQTKVLQDHVCWNWGQALYFLSNDQPVEALTHLETAARTATGRTKDEILLLVSQCQIRRGMPSVAIVTLTSHEPHHSLVHEQLTMLTLACLEQGEADAALQICRNQYWQTGMDGAAWLTYAELARCRGIQEEAVVAYTRSLIDSEIQRSGSLKSEATYRLSHTSVGTPPNAAAQAPLFHNATLDAKPLEIR